MEFITSRFVIKEELARGLNYLGGQGGVLFVALPSFSIVFEKRVVLRSRPFPIF